MAGEAITIARPYAEALFARAQETDSLELWAGMLSMMADVVQDPQMTRVIGNPTLSRDQLTQLMLDIGGGRLSAEGQNLLKLLVANDRLVVLPEIDELYQTLKAESQKILNVHVRSAYALKPAQEKHLADALKAKLGREIIITSEKDAELIGGVHIRAGDMVIDGSISGQLQQLANELGI
ncbi:MAG: F0F1 ATP synthase subunit delta [Gammaproteobacteria bacterium]|nr:F0F1 ATP synthase subunit delta [Gammaproteobacteria bacterium]